MQCIIQTHVLDISLHFIGISLGLICLMNNIKHATNVIERMQCMLDDGQLTDIANFKTLLHVRSGNMSLDKFTSDEIITMIEHIATN